MDAPCEGREGRISADQAVAQCLDLVRKRLYFVQRQVAARQVRTLGQSGDLLLVISVDGNDRSLLAAVQAAHERDMSAIVLAGRSGGNLASVLSETDVLVCVPHDRPTRVREVHQLVLHCMMDGIDTQLLGEEE